ncbi:class I SAM-dependent methyltransferase [Actinocorallia sp. API 0066]|uniref:class I SAM-dependent DNA methyltransferase n=1 Tax=Actinocorallia sp. API 0066 TaxID=2896846 RepID=UPI001E587B22|nr:class I SAM-dependent methyltransferase [Actinocorallia sp. API 0066]MCD0452137.1 class I SAM-dependent methyltransferase [Actinocorallia sp. API 0066]
MYENAGEAEIYDLLYQDRKDYDAEAARVTGLVRERKPDAATLLDVACGTGIHLAGFAKRFARVAGLEVSEPMLARAGERLSGVPLHHGDMRTFVLGETFDAVVCMFSSIGYLRGTTDLDSAVLAMARHLAEGGVLVIEPWYFPDTFIDGYVSAHAVRNSAQGIARVAHSTRQGDATRMEIHYLLGDAATGVRHRSEVDYLTLFSRADYEDAFARAGLSAEYLTLGDGTPGFFVAVATPR